MPRMTAVSAADDLRAMGIKPASDSLSDEEKERRTQAYLDRELGEGDEKMYPLLLAIARGKASIEVLDRFGNPKTKVPSFADQMQAIDMLLNRHRGRPVQKHEHDLKPAAAGKWDPDKLALEELRQMRQLAEKANAVDVEFTEEKEKK